MDDAKSTTHNIRIKFYEYIIQQDKINFALDYIGLAERSKNKSFTSIRYSAVPKTKWRVKYEFNDGVVIVYSDNDILEFLDAIKETIWQNVEIKLLRR